MTALYEGGEARPVGTLTCDEPDCTGTFHDGLCDIGGPSLRMRAYAAGWRMHRPNAYRADDHCPRCAAVPR